MRAIAILGGLLAAGCQLDVAPNLDCLFGCATPGARAGGGACPEGETCSQGVAALWFTGATFGDDNLIFPDQRVKPIASGGVETIGVWTDDIGTQALAMPFAATASGPLTIDQVSGGAIALRGGPGTIAIRDASGALDDELAIDARPISRVVLVLGGPDVAQWARPGEDRAWYLHTGTRAWLTVELRAADGTRLADESMQVTVDGGADPVGWDTVGIDAGDVQRTIAVSATAGGATWPGGSAVVDGVETISPRDPELDDGSAVVHASDGGATTYCFRGVHGGAFVHGGAYAFTSSGPIAITAHDNCVDVTSTGKGDATITATIDSVSRTFALRADQ